MVIVLYLYLYLVIIRRDRMIGWSKQLLQKGYYMQKRVKTMGIFIIIILFYGTASPMLRLKQVKNQSPAYLLMHKKKSEGDPRIPREQKREGFDFVIVAGQAVVQGTGAVITSAGSTAVLVAANYLTKWFTGKDLFRHQLDRDTRRAEKHYDQEADYKAQRKAEKKAMKEEQARAMEMFSATQALSLHEEPSLPKDTTIEINSIKQIDRNNPEDRAWLEDFAKKICPTGGYSITVGGEIRTPTIDEETTYVSAHSMPPMGPRKPNKNNKHDMKHHVDEAVEKFYDAIGHRIGEHVLEEVFEEWREHLPEPDTLKDEPEVKSVYEKTPNYSSGKRLEYWKKDYDSKHTKERTEHTKPFARQLIEDNKTVKENNLEEPVIAQFLPQETTPASGVEIQTNTSNPSASSSIETNASRWAKDDYYSNSGNNFTSSSSSYDRHSSTSSSFSFGRDNDMGCTLFKDPDIKSDSRY